MKYKCKISFRVRCLNIGDRHPKDVSRNATDNNTWTKYGHSSPTKYGNFSRTGNGNFSRTKYGNFSWTEYGRCFEVKHHNASVTKVPCPNGWSFDLEKRQSTIMNEVGIESLSAASLYRRSAK